MNKDVERFLSKVKKTDSGCWEWSAGKFQNGYGQFCVKNKTTKAHRYSYLQFNGEIPENMLVCHKCDNKGCVNPEHLFLGTHSDNMQDMLSKNRQVRLFGESHFNSKLTNDIVYKIRDLYKKNVKQVDIAGMFNIDKRLVNLIVLRKRWTHI